jgi:hypothetical protein
MSIRNEFPMSWRLFLLHHQGLTWSVSSSPQSLIMEANTFSEMLQIYSTFTRLLAREHFIAFSCWDSFISNTEVFKLYIIQLFINYVINVNNKMYSITYSMWHLFNTATCSPTYSTMSKESTYMLTGHSNSFNSLLTEDKIYMEKNSLMQHKPSEQSW